jgi:hypothetical protein
MSNALEADKDRMKRAGYVYDTICSRDNIRNAILHASRRKRDHRNVVAVLEDIDGAVERIRRMLTDKTYTPSPYKVKEIRDGATGKLRTICCPKFYPDQIIHWAAITPLRPVLSRGAYAHSHGGIPGKGTHSALKTCRKWIARDRKNTKYVLKMDVRKFYQSVDNEILKTLLRRVIKDRDALWLLDTIVDSAKGLPIGNYTSVWLSDFCLQGLDHYVKQHLGAAHYIRYVDDMVVFGRNKRKLHKARKDIEEYLGSQLRLTLKANWQVFPLASRDLDFLGYRINRDRVILRKNVALRMRRRAKRIGKKRVLGPRDAAAMASYRGMLVHCDSYNFRRLHIEPYIDYREVRRVISCNARRAQSARAQ